MRHAKFVAYYRVSTAKQGRSGLGLEAQRNAVRDYLVSAGGNLAAEFLEVESGRVNERPQLEAALSTCDLTGGTLIVAKLDRLSRNVAFLAALQESGASFIAADMPEANELTIHIMAAVAQAERKAISTRTREALAAAKARGVRLGGARGNKSDLLKGPKVSAVVRSRNSRQRAAKVLVQIQRIQQAGASSLRQIADGLDARGIVAPRGGAWSASQVRTVLRKCSAPAA